MNAGLHFSISNTVNKLLPKGVTYYGIYKAGGLVYHVKFVNFDTFEPYFEKEYQFAEDKDMVVEIVADAKAFTERWNSPLIQALK